MASEVPGWCKQCGKPLDHAERPHGRAREFCNDVCRQRFHRAVKLRGDLKREVGLTGAQADRLLALFAVSRRRSQAGERDALPSRMVSEIDRARRTAGGDTK